MQPLLLTKDVAHLYYKVLQHLLKTPAIAKCCGTMIIDIITITMMFKISRFRNMCGPDK